jgi:TM2 domain-containing membrane protein YozV
MGGAMKKSLKGALLSGLICPGAGQLWLKKYLRGLILILAVSASMAVVVMKATRQALTILEKIESEGGAMDLVAIMNSAGKASASSDTVSMSAFVVLTLCWIIGIVDAYLVGRKQDLADQVKSERPDKPGPSV